MIIPNIPITEKKEFNPLDYGTPVSDTPDTPTAPTTPTPRTPSIPQKEFNPLDYGTPVSDTPDTQKKSLTAKEVRFGEYLRKKGDTEEQIADTILEAREIGYKKDPLSRPIDQQLKLINAEIAKAEEAGNFADIRALNIFKTKLEKGDMGDKTEPRMTYLERAKSGLSTAYSFAKHQVDRGVEGVDDVLSSFDKNTIMIPIGGEFVEVEIDKLGDKSIKNINEDSIERTGNPAIEDGVQSHSNRLEQYGTGLIRTTGGVLGGLPATIAGGVMGFFSPEVAGAAQYIQENGEAGLTALIGEEKASGVIKTIGVIKKEFEDNPLLKESLESAADAIGVGVAKRVGKKVAPALGKMAEQATQKTGTVLRKTGEMVEKTGKVVETAGEKTAGFVLPVSATEAKMTQKASAGLGKKPRTVGKTTVERGVWGTESMIGTQAEKKAHKMFKEEINPALESIPEKLDKETLFKELEKTVEAEAEEGYKKTLQKGLDKLKDDYKKVKDDTYTGWQEKKSGLYRFLSKASLRGEDVSSGYSQMRAKLAGEIRKATYERLDDVKIKEKYLDYGNFETLKNLGISARKGTVIQKGGSQTMIKALYDKLAVPTGTVGGNIIYKVGEGVEFIGKKGIKTLGEYLEKKGIKKKDISESFVNPIKKEEVKPLTNAVN